MEQLFAYEAEPRPESEDRFLNPSRFPSVRAVYQDFLEEHLQLHKRHGDLSPLAPMFEDTFRKKFKDYYPTLKIPKTNRFAQCDLCFLLRGKMELATMEKKKFFRDQLNAHHRNVLADKAGYYHNR